MTKWLYAFKAKNCSVSRRPQKTAIDSEYNRSFKQTADMYGTLTSIQVCSVYTVCCAPLFTYRHSSSLPSRLSQEYWNRRGSWLFLVKLQISNCILTVNRVNQFNFHYAYMAAFNQTLVLRLRSTYDFSIYSYLPSTTILDVIYHFAMLASQNFWFKNILHRPQLYFQGHTSFLKQWAKFTENNLFSHMLAVCQEAQQFLNGNSAKSLWKVIGKRIYLNARRSLYV